MHKVESRFRFLAASSRATIRGTWPSYRTALLALRERLELRCSAQLATPDLEAELFVHILGHCLEYVRGEGDPDPGAAAAAAHAYDGDGMASAATDAPPRPNWRELVTAPIKFGLDDLLPSLLKLSSALTVSAIGRQAAQRLSSQLLSQHLRFQAAAQLATAGARGGLAQWQRQAALGAAQRGLSSATARYAALRGALSFLGPLMWGWLAVDLAMAALGTDYARIIRAVFVLAQARLTRTHGFVQPEGERGPGGGGSLPPSV